MVVYRWIPTGTGVPIACEMRKTGACVAAECVSTLGELGTRRDVLPVVTLVHVLQRTHIHAVLIQAHTCTHCLSEN